MDRIAPDADNLLLGKGQLLFDRFSDAGASSGQMVHLGDVETLELTTEDDTLEKYSSQTRSAGLLKKITRRRTVTLRATMNEFNAHNIALQLMGNKGVLVQAAAPVVDEPLTASVKLGGYYRLAAVGPVTALSLDMGVTPLVEGTDYRIVDASAGLIQILASSVTVTEGSAVTASYTPPAYTADDGPSVVQGGTKSVIEGRLLFVGDPSTGPKMMVEVWRVSVAPDGALGLITEDWASMGLTMTAQDESAAHPDEPFYRVVYLPDAA